MEKYYIADSDSSLKKDYFDWKKNEKDCVQFIKELLKKYGVEAETFSAGKTFLSIKATENDLINFSGKFLKKSNNGYFSFKKTTHIMKEWIEKAGEYETLHKPCVPFYFKNCYGRMTTRLFEIDGMVYCSIKCDSDFEPCDNLIEMKVSEFFKFIEEYEERKKG